MTEENDEELYYHTITESGERDYFAPSNRGVIWTAALYNPSYDSGFEVLECHSEAELRIQIRYWVNRRRNAGSVSHVLSVMKVPVGHSMHNQLNIKFWLDNPTDTVKAEAREEGFDL